MFISVSCKLLHQFFSWFSYKKS